MVTVADAMLATALRRLFRELDVSEPWRADRLCGEYPEVDFFPERGESTDEAKAVCRRCLVRGECLDYALEHGVKGVWGGLSERERRRVRRDRALAA